MDDLTPKYDLLTCNQKLFNVASTSDLATTSGGGTANADNTTFGQGNSVYKVTSQGIQLGNADFASAPFNVDMDGNLKATSAKITGTITSSTITSTTIIGGLIETSNTDTRVELNGTANELRVYQAGVLVSSLGAFDGADGQMFMINYGTTSNASPVFIRGNVPNTSMAWFANDGNNRAVTISADTNVASGALYVRNGTSTTIGAGIAASFESNSTDPLLPTVYIKNGGTSGTALRLNGALIADDILARTDNTNNIGSTSSYFKDAYIRHLKCGYLEPYQDNVDNLGDTGIRWNKIFCNSFDIGGNSYTPQSITYVTGVTIDFVAQTYHVYTDTKTVIAI